MTLAHRIINGISSRHILCRQIRVSQHNISRSPFMSVRQNIRASCNISIIIHLGSKNIKRASSHICVAVYLGSAYQKQIILYLTSSAMQWHQTSKYHGISSHRVLCVESVSIHPMTLPKRPVCQTSLCWRHLMSVNQHIKYAHAGTMSIQQKAVDIRHIKYAHAGTMSVQQMLLTFDLGKCPEWLKTSL